MGALSIQPRLRSLGKREFAGREAERGRSTSDGGCCDVERREGGRVKLARSLSLSACLPAYERDGDWT
jgi:hypothetical protein